MNKQNFIIQLVISKNKVKLKLITCHFYQLQDFFMFPGRNIKDLCGFNLLYKLKIADYFDLPIIPH